MQRRNIFVLGPDDFTMRRLQSLRPRSDHDFVPLFSYEELFPRWSDTREPASFDDLVVEAERRVAATPGTPAGIVAFWDHPATMLAAVLNERLGLPGPSPLATIRCEHKLYCRRLLREVIPDHIPRFEEIDPFADDAVETLSLPFPFWLKPIKSVASELGFRITSERELTNALAQTRERIGRHADSFAQAMAHAPMPSDIAAMGARYCIAESLIGGQQCTIEGYRRRGEAHTIGIVDSLRLSNSSTFSRYQYPTHLPQAVTDRIVAVTGEVMRHLEYDDGTFNVEYFYDTESEHLWLLEINPRVSQSHSRLFELVDGASNFEDVVAIAIGAEPSPKPGGTYASAAKLFHRTMLRDAVVSAVPSREEIAQLESEVDGVEIQIPVEPGMHLSELPNQDSYSYTLALMHIGAADEGELLDKYQECVDRLSFAFSDIDDVSPADGHHRLSRGGRGVAAARRSAPSAAPRGAK